MSLRRPTFQPPPLPTHPSYAVKSLCLNKAGRKVLIGTMGSEVFEASATAEGGNLNDAALVTGHCRKGLSGLASHPIAPEFATCGEDRTVRIWSVPERKLSRMLELPAEASACGYSPDG